MDILPDTSAVIDGRVSARVEADELDTVYVPEAVVGELEAQANDGRDSGWAGLEELQRLAELAEDGRLDLEYVGRRPAAPEATGLGVRVRARAPVCVPAVEPVGATWRDEECPASHRTVVATAPYLNARHVNYAQPSSVASPYRYVCSGASGCTVASPCSWACTS